MNKLIQRPIIPTPIFVSVSHNYLGGMVVRNLFTQIIMLSLSCYFVSEVFFSYITQLLITSFSFPPSIFKAISLKLFLPHSILKDMSFLPFILKDISLTSYLSFLRSVQT